MLDEHGQAVEEAGPSRPVLVLGLTSVPGAGDSFLVVPEDRVARQIADDSALDVPLNFRLNAASILFNYYNWKTKGDTADPLIARVEPWLADSRATPLNQVWWRVPSAAKAIDGP